MTQEESDIAHILEEHHNKHINGQCRVWGLSDSLVHAWVVTVTLQGNLGIYSHFIQRF